MQERALCSNTSHAPKTPPENWSLHLMDLLLDSKSSHNHGTLSILVTSSWAYPSPYPDAEGTLHHLGGGYGVTGGGAIGAHAGGAYLGGAIHPGGGGPAPIVQKHIYVHVPPPDPDFQGPRQPVIPPPPPKKHYKIVFIKAPSYPQVQAPVIPAPQSDIEKTLIYVLHRNPTDAAPIVIPTAKPTQPAKPEVYFIRYKTKKELGGPGGGHGGGSPHHYADDDYTAVSTTLAPRLLANHSHRPQRLATPTATPTPSAAGPTVSASSAAAVSILPRGKNVHRR
uniref:Tweedle family cuticle protein n=1 Tax=Nilaparvata lugens TaxID=108931 RepID=A0A2S1ZS40_NILLU|nr:tweedle family cuticle protein [Nilaparvata lugens]